MRIGIDIDGVLTNFEEWCLNHMIKYMVENGIDYKIGEFDYEMYKTFNLTEEQNEEYWREYLEFYSISADVRPYASEVIKKLKDEGNEIYILTARWGSNLNNSTGARMREIVKNWLAEKDIVYDKLIFSQAAKERKEKEVVESGINLMIEDSPQNVMGLSRYVPIICFNTTYNKDCNGDNIYRCFSWYDIYKKIKEFNTKG